MPAKNLLPEGRRPPLFLLISIVTILLFGLGWLVATLILPVREYDFFELFPFVLLCGITVDYVVVLTVQSMALAFKIVIALAVIGLISFAKKIFKGGKKLFFARSFWAFFWAIFIVLFFAVAMVAEPLIDWDARSIWFLHAKMIYAAEALCYDTGLAHPSVYFSHPGYPKLVPVIAAQLASFMGYWNEYLPKLSLFFVLLPPVFWLLSFARKSWSFVFLLSAFPFALHRLMWNGYMDGYLAIYLAVAMLLFGRFIQSWRSLDFVSCVACFLFLPNLKREGLLLLFLGFLAIVMTGVLLKKRHRLRMDENFSIQMRQVCGWLLLVAPTLLWYVFYTNAWGITKDAGILGDNGLSLFMSRINDGETLKLIVANIFSQLHLPVLLAALMIVLLLAVRRGLLIEHLAPLLIGSLYAIGLVITYLALDFEINWAMANSTNRTTLMLAACLIVSVFWVLLYLERLEVIAGRRSVRQAI